MYIRKILVILSALVFSAPGYSAVADDAKVIYAGIWGAGRLFVALDKTILEPGCENSTFTVAENHAQIKAWLSIAMAALASGKSVKVRTNGCLGTYPTIPTTNDSYLIIKQN